MLWMWIIITCLAVALVLFTEINNMALRKALTEVKLQRDMLLACVRETTKKLQEDDQK